MAEDLNSYIKTWNRIHKETARALAAVPNDKYDWKPCESAMTMGKLANHLWMAEHGLAEAALTGAFPKTKLEEFNDTAAMVEAFDKSHAELVAKISQFTPEQLAEKIAPFGPDKAMSRRALLTLITEHEIHHRGQLYTYLRIAGCEVPPLHG